MAAKKRKRQSTTTIRRKARAILKRKRVARRKEMTKHARKVALHRRKHASAAKLFVRARTAELIHEGYEPNQAYAIANREAGTSTS